MTPDDGLSRRTYLAGAGAASIALTAGCALLESDEDAAVVLDPPDGYETLREARDAGDVPYPIHGDDLPDVTAPCTLRERDVSTSEFVDERHSMYTFVFSRCHGACPGLVSGLRHVQADAIDAGYTDEVALCTVTFDPEYDTAAVLEAYGDDHGVDYDADNWYFLRPEAEADAHSVVEESFGCYFDRNPDFEDDHHGDDDHHDDEGDHGDDDHHGDGDDDNGGDGNDGGGNGHDEMAFEHESMIVLANADGVVERTWVGEVPSPDVLIADVETLVERW